MVNKKNGIYYTPTILAEYLAEPLIISNNQTVFDPAYGEGALLLAAERIFKKKSKSAELHLFGCDIKPVNGLLNHLPAANLNEEDFFDYTSDIKFETILMNPPYVRQHIQDLENIKKYRLKFQELSILNNNADLWAYFLVKAVSHLEKNGSIGAILPWAFLQSEYAINLRRWLSENFGEIETIALSNKYFHQADERVVIIWLKRYGQKNKSIKIAASKSIEDNITFTELPLHNWLSDKVFYSEANNIEQIFSIYQSEFGFTNFVNHADVKIGVVTGAVNYFILSKKEAKELGFSKNRLIPILRNSSELSNYIKNGKKELLFLVALKNKDHLEYSNFIKKGMEAKYHLRSHSVLRKPWYSVKVGKVADAFFHYRINKIPYMVPNHDRVQCTNSIHRIYFKNLTEVEKKWIMVSLLSSPSQLSLETNSKTYGRGVLKIEPRALKNTLVLKRNDNVIDPIYEQIINLLSNHEKERAVKVASEFVYKQLCIPQDFIRLTERTLSTLQSLRLPHNNIFSETP